MGGMLNLINGDASTFGQYMNLYGTYIRQPFTFLYSLIVCLYYFSWTIYSGLTMILLSIGLNHAINWYVRRNRNVE